MKNQKQAKKCYLSSVVRSICVSKILWGMRLSFLGHTQLWYDGQAALFFGCSGRYTLQETAHPRSQKRFRPTAKPLPKTDSNAPRHFVSRSSYVAAVGDPKVGPRDHHVVPERDGAAGQGDRQSRAAPDRLHRADYARHSPQVGKRLLQRSS